MQIYEIITENDERIIPLEESEAWKLSRYTKIDKKIEEIVGQPQVSRICIRSFYYMNPGKRFHIDVLAENEEEAMRILNENRETLEKVYLLFGEKLGGFRTWGSYPYIESPLEKRSLLERLATRIFS